MPGVRSVLWRWNLAAAPLLALCLVGTARAQLPPGATPAPTLPMLPSQEAKSQGPAPGQEPVVDVRIVGNRAVSLAKIVPHVRTRAGRPFDMTIVEADVRRLMSTKMFVKVTPFSRRVEGGVVVVFELLERPTLQYVKYLGNKKIKDKALHKETDLKTGDPLDPVSVEDGRRKIEDYYHEKGFSKIRVTVLEGNRPDDKGAIYLINEGQKQRVLWTDFVGNTIASDGRLRTQIESKPGIFWFFKGEVDRKKIDEDIERLTAYYRGLGFFNAKVGRELQFTESQEWLNLTFVINEGPRYKVRSVAVLGNTKFNTEDLLKDRKLNGGEYFNQSQMNSDVTAMQDKYGGIGYVFADVKADPRFLEEPGQLDLVYNVTEGDRYRVGEIRVNLEGDYPRTRISTIYNRLSLRPGDIVDTRKLRDSERRLQASGLFLADPAQGVKPKIVFSPPEVDTETASRQKPKVARDPGDRPGFRGQSPDPPDRVIDLTLLGKLAPPEQWPPAEPLPVQSQTPATGEPGTAAARPAETSPWSPALEGPRQIETNFQPATLPVPSRPAVIVRGQYSPNAGYSTPTLESGPSWSGSRAATAPSYGTTPGYGAAPNYGPTPGAAGAALPQGPGQMPGAPSYAIPAPTYTQPPPQLAAPAPVGAYGGTPVPVASAPSAVPAPTATPAAEPLPTGPAIMAPGAPGAGPAMGPQPGVTPAITQESPWGVPPVQQPLFPQNSVFAPTPEEELTRPLPLDVIARETETGRLMIGAGINSDAGLFGQFVIDERNFSISRWPRNFEDVRSGRAFRGDGQQLRLEAVPGTEFHRYMINFREPYLFDTEIGLLLSGFYYTRNYLEWDEERLGGRVGLIYQFNHDLSGTASVRAENVKIFNPITPPGAADPNLRRVLGDNGLYGFELKLAHDTRDSAFLPTQGHLIEMSFEQVVGTFSYPRGEIDVRRHFTLFQRPDGSGRHVLSLAGRFMASADNTPIYEHYYLGGFSTLRGFDFRGVGPIDNYGVRTGGNAAVLASIEYMFPITADDMLRGVVFCDTGTTEASLSKWNQAYRVAPGFGLRITIPALGPAPIALDLAFPISNQRGDEINNFSFFIGVGR